MLEPPPARPTAPDFDPPSPLAPHRVVLIVLWLVTSVALVVLLAGGVRDTDRFGAVRHVLHAAYVVALLWHLARTGPSLRLLPEVPPFFLPRWRFGRWIPVLIVVLLFVMTAAADEGADNLLLLLMLATIWMLIVWRREIRLRHFALGLAVAAVALLTGHPFYVQGFIAQTGFLLFLTFVPLMFTAAGPLLARTGVGASRLHEGRYGRALASFLWGCVLFVPLGLINAADGSPGAGFDWVDRAWMPVTLPFFSGLVEEVWHRLLLVTLCAFLLRPAFRSRPAVAVVAAVLFSAITFGLGHGRNLDKFLTTGMLYGVPLAVVFVRRDWEHAVGAHYMINMIPWLAVFLAR